MGLFIKRDKGDDRSRRQVLEDVEEDIARKVFGRCSLFCGDVECKQGCMRDKDK